MYLHWEKILGIKGFFNIAATRIIPKDNTSGWKLKSPGFKLEIRDTFLIARVISHWIKLPREMEDSPSFDVLKSKPFCRVCFSQTHYWTQNWGNGEMYRPATYRKSDDNLMVRLGLKLHESC